MKNWSLALAVSALVAVFLGALFYLFLAGGLGSQAERVRPAATSSPDGARLESLQAALDRLEARTDELSSRPPAAVATGEPAAPADASNGALVERFEAVENEIRELRRTLENLVPATEVMTEKFAEPTGFAHADAYFDDGKFATAAGGYLTFLESNPNHPDALDIMRKARDAYHRAGYRSLAIDVQKKILAEFPVEDRYAEIMTLADLEKKVKRYDDAMAHAEQALEAATTPAERLTAISYRSWYVELGQGAAAGLAAYRDAAGVARSMGLGDSNAAKKIGAKIEQLQKIVDAEMAKG